MRRIHDRVAGLDIHKSSVTACAEWVEGKEVRQDTTSFSTMASGVEELAGWLSAYRVSYVVMESTGVYWKPVYYRLEGCDGVELALVNAGHVKQVPGRKTDMSDAQWLADLAAHGMVRASFVPPKPIRELRELTRYRKQLIRCRVQEIQRLEKVFQDAGIKFTSVASAVWLKSSQAMVEALIAGERDALVLAGFARGRLVNKHEALAEAMRNRWQDYHSRLARELIDHIHSLDRTIDRLSAEIEQACRPWSRQLELLCTVPGVATRSAESIIAETGADMAVFETADHLASWCGLAPGNHRSANRSRPARTLFGNSTIKTVMVECAKAAVRQDGYLRAKRNRIARRRGPNKATIAVARAQIVGIWHMLTNNEPWRDLGADYYQRRDPKLEAARLAKRIKTLGYNVELTPLAA